MPQQERKIADAEDLGTFVRFYRNGWRFGRLLGLGRKYARVLYNGKIERLSITEVFRLVE